MSKKTPVIWAVERQTATGKWDPTIMGMHVTKRDADADKCSYWQDKWPSNKYRVAKYIRVEAQP